MRQLINSLMILLVVLLVGLSALVLLINPNDFRDYLVQTSAKNGYQLVLDDSLRWRIWPDLSILTGHLSLTATGASQPVISADNMRLDVKLWPLLSHQLQINQVTLKNAVILLSPQSESQPPANAPVAPAGGVVLPDDGWKYRIAGLHITDSVLVVQPDNRSPLTVRDLNLRFNQNEQQQGQLLVSARINRNQHDLRFSLQATLDGQRYPQQLQADISKVQYQWQGPALPRQGITGNGAVMLTWNGTAKQVTVSQLQLSANYSQMQGNGNITWQQQPDIQMALQFSKLDLDNLLISDNASSHTDNNNNYSNTTVHSKSINSAGYSLPVPVIARFAAENYRGLHDFSLQLAMYAEQVNWRGLMFNQVSAQLTSQHGLLNIKQLQGQFAGGQIALPGSLDADSQPPVFNFQPVLKQVPITPLLQAFNYPAPVTGTFDLTGNFSGPQLTASDFRQHWQGQADISLESMRLIGMNIPQLINQSLAQTDHRLATIASSTEANSNDNPNNSPDNTYNTPFTSFTARVQLRNGILSLKHIDGRSPYFQLSGSSRLDLLQQQSDSQLALHLKIPHQENISIADKSALALLQNTAIPLRIYGSWDALNYSFPLSQLLQHNLRDEARSRLQHWLEHQQSSQK